MSFWGRLFGAPEIVDKTVDAVVATGDALFYTEEEKAESKQKVLDWALKWHEATSGSRLARRFIGVMFTAVFLALVVITAVLYGFGAFFQATDPETGAVITHAATNAGTAIATLVADALVIPVGIIVTFYFGGPAIANIKKGKD